MMDKHDNGKTGPGLRSLRQFRPHNPIKNSISSILNQVELKVKSKVQQNPARRPVTVHESMEVKLSKERLSRPRGFHKGDGDSQRVSTAKPNHLHLKPKAVIKLPSTDSMKKQLLQTEPKTRFLGTVTTLPKLETKSQTQVGNRLRAKPLQSIQLRTMSLKDQRPTSSVSNVKAERRNSNPVVKPKIPEKVKPSPYKNQLSSIYSQTNRPRSRPIKDSFIDEIPSKPLTKWSRICRLDKFESMYNNDALAKDISKQGAEKFRNIPRRLRSTEILENPKEKIQKQDHHIKQFPDKKKASVTIVKTRPKSVQKSPPSSRQSPPLSITADNGSMNFAAILLQTTEIIESAIESARSNNIADDGIVDTIVLLPNISSVNNSTQTMVDDATDRLQNIDDLPYPLPGDATVGSEANTVNPPVNTPVSPRSPISDSNEPESPTDSNKANDSDEDINKLWSKDADMEHDFVNDFFQLESLKEFNTISQAMCRTSICRQVKGADPNLSLEALKLTNSHYLHLPCFEDPTFFSRIKIPANIFMNGKTPDKDLIAIQYLQDKMDMVYQNNIKAYENLKKSKPDEVSATVHHSTDSLSVDLNVSRERYVQSLSNLFTSLQFPEWAKECFGSGSEEEGFTSAEDELQSTKPVTDCSAERSTLAKRILNMFDNGKLNKLNSIDKASRAKKNDLTKDYDDDTSSDNISETP